MKTKRKKHKAAFKKNKTLKRVYKNQRKNIKRRSRVFDIGEGSNAVSKLINKLTARIITVERKLRASQDREWDKIDSGKRR